MNIEMLREQLEIDEGCVYEIYNDHLGYPTFGIGHLVRSDDPEHGSPVGTEVSKDRVAEAFDSDIESVLSDCRKLYPNIDDLPEEAQLIIANMMFNLGYPRLSKFKNMKRCVDERDWLGAGEEMMDSRWYQQVPNRAGRLINRMKLIGQ